MTQSATLRSKYDVVVVGSGPNGLSAAIALAEAGLSTLVVEAHDSVGGGMRTLELTERGFRHDVCSSVHPLGVASPFFRRLGLERYGLSWIESPAELAHVLDEERVVTLERSIDATAAQFGEDAESYRELLAPFVANFDALLASILGPLRFPKSPVLLARFGLRALRSMAGIAKRFRRDEAPALMAGIAGHAMVPLDALATSSFALVLGIAGHTVGWPLARGGSQAIADALVLHLRKLGGEVITGLPVTHIDELPEARAYVFNVTPKQLLEIAGSRLPANYRERLKQFRYGPGVCKVDWALRGPIPWRNPACARAITVHLAGTLDEIAAAEASVHTGKVAARPFVLVVQPSLFDDTRAPNGMHVGWAYTHVPHDSDFEVSELIEATIERYAPGFRQLVLSRAVKTTSDMERYNANYVGGDINGGISDLGQLFFRPMLRADPYSTPNSEIFICSSSTPPGGGVHGMCGYWAARSVLTHAFGHHPAVRVEPLDQALVGG